MAEERVGLSFLDFEIEIGQGEAGEYSVKVLRSPAGEAQATLNLPFDNLQLERYQDKLQIALLRSAEKRRQMVSPEEQVVQEFGGKLFDVLLTGEVRSRYDISQAQARQQGKGLRLKLRIQPPELAALPWEFLYDPRRDGYVCLSANTPVVRYLELPQPLPPLAVEPPLRILGMLAGPRDASCPALDVETEKARLEQALLPLLRRGLAELAWLSKGTWQALQRSLRKGPWHIFHFIGHGRYNPATGQGELAFEDETGGLEAMGASRLATLLADHQPLRLALLNACGGAQGGQEDIFSSTAATLVRRGLPAVLAMQYAITDRAAIEIARAFYEALADGLPVDAAVAETRKALKVSNELSLEWGTPVLYTHAPDGALFNLMSANRSPVTQSLKYVSAPLPALEERHYQDGLEAYRLGDWLAAERNFQAAIDSNPDYRDAAVRLVQARQQAQLAGLVAQAKQLHSAQRWQAVLSIFEQIRAIQPDYPDPDGLFVSATRALAQEQQQTKRADLHRRAASLLLSLQKATPDYPGIDRLLERAGAEQARQSERAAAKPPRRLLPWILGLLGLGLVGMLLVWAALSGILGGGETTATLPVIAVATTPAPFTKTPLIPMDTPAPTPTWLLNPRVDEKGVTMALIPAGQFLMGSPESDSLAGSDERPQHRVYLDAFYIDMYEVTNARYAQCVAAGGCTAPVGGSSSSTRSSYYGSVEYENYPAIYVDWDQASAYCTWRDGRLPTEAEWEKAARGGLEGAKYPWGDEAPVCTKEAKNGAQFVDCSPEDTVAVSSFSANGYGLFDMAGNVWEWVQDWYGTTYYRNQSSWSNPIGPDSGQDRVVRGGAWHFDGNNLRAAFRVRFSPAYGYDNVGFRCSRSP